MSDIGLTWDAALGGADFTITANDLETDDSLETAIMLSLFTDRRAEVGDELPDAEVDRRGWWGDVFPVVQGDRFGSRLWLLARAKTSPALPQRAKEYVIEALQWLLDDKVASQVEVESGIVAKGVLGLGVTIHRPEADPVTFRYNYEWAAQAARAA